MVGGGELNELASRISGLWHRSFASFHLGWEDAPGGLWRFALWLQEGNKGILVMVALLVVIAHRTLGRSK